MASTVYSFAISGVDGRVVEVETDLIGFIPSISIVGLGDTAVKEARERLEAALTHEGFGFPQQKIVINLAPSDMKKTGTHYDLAMAVGILIRSQQIQPAFSLDSIGFIGELSLNAGVRPCSGVLPMAVEAKERGIRRLVVARENVREARLVKGLDVYGCNTLAEVIDLLNGEFSSPGEGSEMDTTEEERPGLLDFADVKGQGSLIEDIAVAAAGGHNILMIGPPGVGKSMLAKRIPTILPEMNEQEALEVTKIYSVSGLLKHKGRLIVRRPYRAPHHNASSNALIGGGQNAKPGEISLSHNGVLFLDEMAEFTRKTLDALRQPMEDRQVTITRVNGTNTYPANFMLVGAMNPCPCGFFSQKQCRCTDYEIMKYRQKLSGPILDRMAIQKYVNVVNFFEKEQSKTTSNELRERVGQARKIQQDRYQNIQGVNCNAQLGASMINDFCQLDQDTQQLLEKAYDRFHYSGRTVHKFIKTARTFADLDGAPEIRKTDMMKSLMSRDLEKDQQEFLTV